MNHFIHKYICGILVLLLTGYFFFTKDLNNKYDKVVMAEGHGYYVYLPAAFIYHDHAFNFFNDVSRKYYYPSFEPPVKNFINEFDGIRVNKYFPGVSLLWLPFFLLAHLLALLFHLQADGYSDIYQYAIGLAGIIYTYFGLKFTNKLLTHFDISPFVRVFTLSILLFGTNLLLYSAGWSAQTHCYSFFLIAGFFWFIVQLFHPGYDKKNYYLGMSFVFLAMIISVRPQNAAILLMLPFFGLTKSNFLTVIRRHLFSWFSILGILIACFVAGRVCYYWYIQTGRLFLNPYHGEHYYFNKPHMLEVLFGYRQGWIMYSPFIAVGLAGIFFIKKIGDKINLFLYWGLFLYVSSCWWCWTYGSTSFGQRAFVDFYCLIALQSAVLLDYFYKRKLKMLPPVIAAITIPLCILQTYQYKHGIIPGEYASAETYWGNFFVTHPISFYPVPNSSITDRLAYDYSTEPNIDSTSSGKLTYSGERVSFISSSHPFTEQKYYSLPSFMPPGDNSIVRVTARVNTPAKEGNEFLNISFIKDGKAISESKFSMHFYLRNGKWIKYQYGTTVPDHVSPGDSVLIYFQKTEGKDTVYIDGMKVEFLHTDHSYEFHM